MPTPHAVARTGPPDPAQAETPAQFVEQLNKLRVWAGQPSLRALRDLAGARPGSGDPPADALPTSTTHELLSGKRLPRLPRLDLVEPFVVACLRAGRCAPAEIEEATAAWRRHWCVLAEAGLDTLARTMTAGRERTTTTLAAVSPVTVAAVDGNPIPLVTRRPPPVWWLALAAVVVLFTGGMVVVLAMRPISADPPAVVPTPPADAAGIPGNLLINGTFDAQREPWWMSEDDEAEGGTPDGRAIEVEAQALRLDVPVVAGPRWSVTVGQNHVPIIKGHTYQIQFSASVSGPLPLSIHVVVQEDDAPRYPSVLDWEVILKPSQETYTRQFQAVADLPAGQLVLQLGGHDEPYTIWLDDVSLIDQDAPERPY